VMAIMQTGIQNVKSRTKDLNSKTAETTKCTYN
jgi:hypothetical protein